MIASESKVCPVCKLINPASAEVCDCGFHFKSMIVFPYERRFGALIRRRAGIRGVLLGFICAGGGAILALNISWDEAPHGVLNFIGLLILFGLCLMVRGTMTIAGIR